MPERSLQTTIRVAVILVLAAGFVGAATEDDDAARDLAAARAVFEANLAAIKNKDREAYLACYLKSPALARTGYDGIQLGFEALAAETANGGWPDTFEAQDLQLVRIRPGLVYGTYRVRAFVGTKENQGISERLFLETPEGWKIAVTTGFVAPPGTPPPPRALVGAVLVDGRGGPAVPDAVVVMRGGTIDCAGTRAQCPVPPGVATQDVSGFWLTPGLVDAHVHLSQTGWADGRPDSLDLRKQFPYDSVQAALRTHPQLFFRSYLCSGVTAVFDVGGYPWTWALRQRAETDTLAPHVAATGPLLSTRDHWLNLPGERQFLYLADDKAAREGARYLASQRADAIKVWFIGGGERPFEEMAAAVRAAGEEATSAQMRLIVHATELRLAKEALRAGAKLLVHSVWDEAIDDEFVSLARKNEAIYCPTLTVTAGYARLFEAVLGGTAPVVDDPNGCVDAGTLENIAATPTVGAGLVDREAYEKRAADRAKRDQVAGDNLRRAREAGLPIAMGTDAGNPLTLHGPSVHAEMETMQAAGLTPMEVVVAATRVAARAMGRGADLGTVQKGKAADLLLLADDPTRDVAAFRRVRYVVRGGVVRPLEELRVRP
jgi:imidazolonepropionase-like amidohydrolase